MKVKGEFDSIPEVIEDVRKGKLVILTDDEDRENEGDFILAAQKVTPASVNFMAKHGRGLICCPITHRRAQQLGLQRMVVDNRESFCTDFTVSVDAAKGVTTGISAHDRARTIKLLSNKKAKPNDFVQPGHVFPLQAKEGGVLRRAGHTEAAMDLARLAGLDESAVLCEILKEDGTMARLPDLFQVSKQFGLKIATIQGLIEYRRRTEQLVVCEEKSPLETDYGKFEFHRYVSVVDGAEHFALVKGKISKKEPVLVRVHSEIVGGDVFGARKPGKSPLHDAMRKIAKAKKGVLVYMRQQHHRPEGFSQKELKKGKNGVMEIRRVYEPPMDLREYGLGAQILFAIGVRKMKLLTNHPRRVVGLAGYGLDLVDQIPLK